MPKRPNLSREQQREAALDYARCRTLRHAWDPIGSGDRRPQFGVLVCLRCVFCGTLRYDKFSPVTGERIDRPQYDYPAGYRGEKHDQSWWRAAWSETVTDLLVHPEDSNVKPVRKAS